MRKLISIFTLALLYVTISFGQAEVEIPFTVADNDGNSIPLVFGLDLTATGGIDPALGEIEQPPLPPSGVFDGRFVSNAQATLGQGTLVDIRNAPAWLFTGQYIHQIYFQTGGVGTQITVSWDLPPEIQATSTITDIFGGVLGYDEIFAGIGSITVTNPGAVTGLIITVDYLDIGPPVPAPEFVIAPTSLDFGPVAVGVPTMLQATVSNPGTDPLDITSIVSSDPQYTFTPATATIAPSGNQIFDITFTPAGLGTFPADIEFTHNAPTNPDVLPVTGVGADAGPTFGVAPGSLNFGTVTIPGSQTLQLTVTNNGLFNTMNITSVAGTLPEYTVVPATAVILPGANQVFDVTFTPLLAGTYAGDVVFTHDGSTSPDAVPVTGDGYVPAAVNGLVFEKDTVWNLEEDFYTETMQLLDVAPGPTIKALQFRLLVNQNVDDTPILTFQGIEKGSSVADASWILEYNIIRGPILPNGASVDEVLVLLYNINQGPGWALGAGDHTELFLVNYRVADLPALEDSTKSSFLITNAEASTFEGFPVDITPSRDELVVNAKNRVGSWGDVNGDGCLDILDLIMVVDHIVGRDSLDADEFARADIAPWTPGAGTVPVPDGFVNVQDLALIQNTILTGFFPDGTPVGGCPSGFAKFNGEADAILNLYINKDGITAYLDSKVGIRGAQIEFGNMIDDPGSMVINTELGDGYYLKVDEMLRTLMYDRLAEKYVEAGTYQFMADMPFSITNPEDISLDKLILVDIDQQKVMKLEVNLIYTTPTLPYEYILFQNYPNPFNPSTSVRFQVPQTGNVTVKIYDMLGQEVRTLFTGEVVRGTYTTNWDGLNDAGTKMSSGSYIYRMIAGEFTQSKKMILLK